MFSRGVANVKINPPAALWIRGHFWREVYSKMLHFLLVFSRCRHDPFHSAVRDCPSDLGRDLPGLVPAGGQEGDHLLGQLHLRGLRGGRQR